MAIHRLSVQLANQIAAGEVVERPSSVVKELLENAVDAGADEIRCFIEGAGRISIKVSDNGSGIPCDELELALAPHATSKISSTEDLENITTMGFRGEALASIASVTKLTLSSRTADEADGYCVSCDGPQMEASVIPCPHGVGTTVEARELFFNTPARRRFLRSDRTESARIRDVFTRCALAHPQISFELFFDGKSVVRVKKALDEGQKLKRISVLAGAEFAKEGVRVSCEDPLLQIEGVAMCGADASQGGAEKIFLFLNNRPVADKTVMHAVREAYAENFDKKSAARCVLYLSCDPHECDVNVHPRKDEVRFHHARAVHDLISQSLLTAFERFFSSEAADDEDMDGLLSENELAKKNTPFTSLEEEITPPELCTSKAPTFEFPSGTGAFFARRAEQSTDGSRPLGDLDMEGRRRDFLNMTKSHAKASRIDLANMPPAEYSPKGSLANIDPTNFSEQDRGKGKEQELCASINNEADSRNSALQGSAPVAVSNISGGSYLEKGRDPCYKDDTVQDKDGNFICRLTHKSALICRYGHFYLVNCLALKECRASKIIAELIEAGHMPAVSPLIPFSIKLGPDLLKALKKSLKAALLCGFDIEIGRSSVSVKSVPQFIGNCALQELCLRTFPLIAASDELSKGRCPKSIASILARAAVNEGIYAKDDPFVFDELNDQELKNKSICRELDLVSLALNFEEKV